jgi:hypothetical protein
VYLPIHISCIRQSPSNNTVHNKVIVKSSMVEVKKSRIHSRLRSNRKFIFVTSVLASIFGLASLIPHYHGIRKLQKILDNRSVVAQNELDLSSFIDMNKKLSTKIWENCECGCPTSTIPECPRGYSPEDVDRSAKVNFGEDVIPRDVSNYMDLELMKRRHSAQIQCLAEENKEKGVTDTGGYCLGKGNLSGSMILPFPDRSIKISSGHYPACRKFLANLIHFIKNEKMQSLSDFGAGQGQYGVQIQKTFPETLIYRGYDGAGDVEIFTESFLSFFDLTIPLKLPVSDWVMSLEVGEHIPSNQEGMMIRNLHAHNCKGIILSWSVAGHGGHHHVNLHNNKYLIDIFSELGYDNDVESANLMTSNIPQMWGFLRKIMIFRRRDPVC